MDSIPASGDLPQFSSGVVPRLLDLQEAFDLAKARFPHPLITHDGYQRQRFQFVDAYETDVCHPAHLRGRLVLQQVNGWDDDGGETQFEVCPRNHWGFTVAVTDAVTDFVADRDAAQVRLDNTQRR